jgi:hypothetical protein
MANDLFRILYPLSPYSFRLLFFLAFISFLAIRFPFLSIVDPSYNGDEDAGCGILGW